MYKIRKNSTGAGLKSNETTLMTYNKNNKTRHVGTLHMYGNPDALFTNCTSFVSINIVSMIFH